MRALHVFMVFFGVTCCLFPVFSLAGVSTVIPAGQTLPTAAGFVSESGDAVGNTLHITGGSVTGTAYGGTVRTGSGAALGNAVVMDSGSVGGSVMGGFSPGGDASGNSVTINGGSVAGDIYGGRATVGKAVNNVVTLGAGAQLSPNAFVFGGIGGVGKDEVSGNVLNVRGFQGSLFFVGNFQNYNFSLPASVGNGSVLLTITGAPADLTHTGVSIVSVAGGRLLHNGDTITLMRTVVGSPATTQAFSVKQGAALQYDFDLAVKNQALVATVKAEPVSNPSSSALLKPHAASLALLNQSLDALVSVGVDSLASALDERGDSDPGGPGLAGGSASSSASSWGIRPFAALRGGYMRFHLDNYVDMWGGTGVIGLGKKWEAESVRTQLGAFFELGSASYESNTQTPVGQVRGRGNAGHEGGGLLARVDVTQGALRGLHADATFRAGGVRSSFSAWHDSWAGDFSGAGGQAEYTVYSSYLGGHVGLGHVFALGDSAASPWLLDVYARYHWTRMAESSATVLGDSIDFAVASSSRWQGGARLARAVTEAVSLYVGGMYEYDADGRMRASVYGIDLPEKSLNGSTFMGEAGLIWRPVGSNMRMDFSVQGFAGKKAGVLGSLQWGFEF